MSNEYGAEADDPMNKFLQGLASKNLKDDIQTGDQGSGEGIHTEPQGSGNQVNDQQVQNQPVDKTAEAVAEPLTVDKLTPEQQLDVFRKLTNIDVKDFETVKSITETLNRMPEYEKIVQTYPKLLEELKKKQDIMGYFPDENTFKAVQLSKDARYKGKESALFNLFNADLSQMGDMDLIALGAALEKSPKISNPLRSAIKQIGLDPDEVLTNFEQLSQDDKDDIAALADEYRTKLTQLISSVQVPNYSSDIEKELQEMEAKSKDDFNRRLQSIAPISMNVVNGIKDIKVKDDFNFEVEMTPEERKGYADFLTNAIMSGEFDVSTDDGKAELYEALMTEVWVDNRKKILDSYETHLRSKLEAEFRAKYNNEKPLENSEQLLNIDGEKVNPVVSIIHQMIREKQ